jgi:Cu2+-exporting ATPase
VTRSSAAAAAQDRGTCVHCGLLIPRGGDERFCCAGCRTAYAVIHEKGLSVYYRLPEKRGVAVTPSGKRFEEFDHAAFRDLYVRPLGRAPGLVHTTLYLEGVHCASCVWLVERIPLAVPGVMHAELDVGRSLVRIVWDEARAQLSEIARFLDTLGYRPRPYRGMGAEGLRRAADRAMLGRIGVAGAIAVNVMLLALALYSGWFHGMERSYERFFRWVSLALVTPSMVGPALVFFRGAVTALRHRTLHMDVPIAVALAAGYARGAWNTVVDRGPVYFDGLGVLIFLLLVGRYLQQRAHRSATDSAELLHSLSPSTARLAGEDGVTRDVPVEALLPGMLVEVRPGETVPADGVVTEGASSFDLSLLTGETRPVDAAACDVVYAGTLNRAATVRVRVEQAGEASRVGRILAEVDAAARRRAPAAQIADRVAAIFVGVILALGAATYVWWARVDGAAAIDNAIALLIVTCPCALALATPLAITVAIGKAARAGILVKGGAAMEALARPGVLYLDKTGTLTEGRSTLAAWNGPDDVRPLVLALEAHSPHPIAAGFRAAWPGVEVASAENVMHAPGGLRGTVRGHTVAVGSPAFTGIERGDMSDALTPVIVTVGGACVARAAFGDAVRPDARAALDVLRARGWEIRILSGDDPAVVDRVARELGVDPAACRGGATPEDKLQVVEDATRGRHVVMVGDGVNDAAAIARATVGIGVRGGAEACLSAADVFLARPGLAPLADLIEGAARTVRVIRRNLAFSLVYNTAGVVLAATGVITPLIAAILMPASSITVISSSWAARPFPRRTS